MTAFKATPSNASANVSSTDAFYYQVENRISSNLWFPFSALAFFFACCTVLFGVLWFLSLNLGRAGKNGATDDQVEEIQGYLGKDFLVAAFWVSFQVLTTAGFEDDIPSINGLRRIYFAMIVFG